MTTQEIDNQKFHAGDMVRKKTTGETGEIVKLNTNGKQLMPSYLVKPKDGDSVYWWEHDIEICHECGGYMAKGGSIKTNSLFPLDDIFTVGDRVFFYDNKKRWVYENGSPYSGTFNSFEEAKNSVTHGIENEKDSDLFKWAQNNKKSIDNKFAKGGKISGASRYVKMSICSLKEASKHLEQAISKKHKEVSKGIKDGEYKRKFEKSLHTAKSKLKDIQEAISHKVKFEHGGVMPDCPCMQEDGGNVSSRTSSFDKNYSILESSKSGYDLYYIDDKTGYFDIYVGNFDTIEDAKEKAEEDGYVKFKYSKYAKGGEVGDNKFIYMMLGRLKSDCDYYLGNGNRSERNLWAKSVDEQIKEMKRIWNSLPKNEKPEWLSMEDIEDYESKMKNEYAKGGQLYKYGLPDTLRTKLQGYYEIIDGDKKIENVSVFSPMPYNNESWQFDVEQLHDEELDYLGFIVNASALNRVANGSTVTAYAPRIKKDIKIRKVKQFAKGGQVTFKQKSNAVAKRLEGEKVPAKYQSEYGKTYSKEEAHEAADKIIGKFVSRTGMKAKGGTIVFKIKGDSDTIENRALLKKALSDKSKQNSVTYKIKVGDNIPSNTKIGDTLLYEILKYKNPSLVIDIVDNGKSIKVVQNNEVRYTPYKI